MIVTKDFSFAPANSSRTLHIYLPDDYYQSQEVYPCMYYFDGQNLFFDYEASFGTSWGLKDFLDIWPKKMVVVGIECSHQGNQRLAEYSPYSFFEEPFGQIEAYGKETLNWLVSELKPYIDQKFRTYPFREATGIAGSSMGGLMAAYAGIAFNNYFSKMACLSSALSFNFEELMTDLSKQELNADSGNSKPRQTKISLTHSRLRPSNAISASKPPCRQRGPKPTSTYKNMVNTTKPAGKNKTNAT